MYRTAAFDFTIDVDVVGEVDGGAALDLAGYLYVIGEADRRATLDLASYLYMMREADRAAAAYRSEDVEGPDETNGSVSGDGVGFWDGLGC
jgi:hypothetical protein